MFKLHCTIVLISQASKVMLKILQPRLQQYVNCDIQSGFRKGRGARDQIATICWIIKKHKRVPEKNIYFCFIDSAKAFDCVDHNKLWKILKDRNTRPLYLPSEKSVSRSRSNRYNWTWNYRLVPNWERSASRLYIVTLLI